MRVSHPAGNPGSNQPNDGIVSVPDSGEVGAASDASPRRLDLAVIKYVSMALLLLGTGFAQLSAAVIYTPVSGNYSVTTAPLPGSSVFTVDLPGTNDLVVIDFSFSNGSVPLSNFYQLSIVNSGGAYIPADILEGLYYAHSLNVDETWDNLSGGQTGTIYGANLDRMPQTGAADYYPRSNPTYVPFWFYDTSDSNLKKYGYVTLSTYETGSGASAVLHLDLSGYAYENSGAKIQMGAVPEPSAFVTAALGILGCKVMRRWRTKRTLRKTI